MGVQVLGVLFAIVVLLAIATSTGRIASRKGRPFWLYFLAGLIVGPIALVGALLLPRRRPR
jgi:Kef-type K+ transport system membrane component KefB